MNESTVETPFGKVELSGPTVPQQAEVLTPAAISVLNDRLDMLVRLSAVHDSGVLTDEEFDREKRRLMAV